MGIRDRPRSSRTWTAFTRVMDRANRAGVVVYSMDARGLQTGGLTRRGQSARRRRCRRAADRPRPIPARIRETITAPGAAGRMLLDSQDSLVYLAQQTGGFAVLNTNDLVAGMTRVIDDTRGYYLLGFDTSIPANDRWDPNDIRIHVKRPGLTVRARRGLFGPADKERPRDAAPANPLVAATLSPFATGAIDVRLTTLFAHDKTAGSYVRSLFFIDPAGLTFAVGPDGRHEADLSLLLLAVGDNGQPVAQAPPPGPAAARRRGLRTAAPARSALQRATGDQGGRRLPDPRRRAGRSLEGDRDERPVRRSAEGRQGPRRPVGRRDDGRRCGWHRRAGGPRPPVPCAPTSSPTASSASRPSKSSSPAAKWPTPSRFTTAAASARTGSRRAPR